MSGEVIQMVMKMSILSVLSIFSIKWMMDHFAPDSNAKKKSQNRAAELLKRLGLQTLHNLSDYEMAIAAQLVVPGDITVSWNDIAGLDNLIAELKESVVLPLKNWRMFQSSNLYSAPRGVLFHGPPGMHQLFNTSSETYLQFQVVVKHWSRRLPRKKLELVLSTSMSQNSKTNITVKVRS